MYARRDMRYMKAKGVEDYNYQIKPGAGTTTPGREVVFHNSLIIVVSIYNTL